MGWGKNIQTDRQRTERAYLIGVDHFVMIRITTVYIHICVIHLISVS